MRRMLRGVLGENEQDQLVPCAFVARDPAGRLADVVSDSERRKAECPRNGLVRETLRSKLANFPLPRRQDHGCSHTWILGFRFFSTPDSASVAALRGDMSTVLGRIHTHPPS